MTNMNWRHQKGIMTHPAQWKLWEGLRKGKIHTGMTLRKIGEIVGLKHPQIVLHHLQQLQKKGYLEIGWWKGERYWKLTDRIPPELI